MKTNIKKGSKYSRTSISSNTLKTVNAKTNESLDIEFLHNNKNISLEEKFKEYNGKNLAKDFSWDESVGKEIL